MADAVTHHHTSTLEAFLWDALESHGLGFLGLTKSGLHPQPAMAFVDRRRRRLWLATLADSELVRSVADGGAAIFTCQGPGLLASVGGALSLEEDARRLPRLWTAQAQAWRPQGPGDPALSLLRLDGLDAEVSLPEIGLRRFTWDLGRPPLRGRPRQTISPHELTLH